MIACGVGGACGLALAVAHALPLLPRPARARVEPILVVSPGERGELSITVLDQLPRGSPLQLTLRSEHIELPENRLDHANVVDPRAEQLRMRTQVVAPTEPGTYAIDGWLQYVTCPYATACISVGGALRWTVEVPEPPVVETPST